MARTWRRSDLEHMAKHYRSAVEMPEKERQEGRYEPAKEMDGGLH